MNGNGEASEMSGESFFGVCFTSRCRNRVGKIENCSGFLLRRVINRNVFKA